MTTTAAHIYTNSAQDAFSVEIAEGGEVVIDSDHAFSTLTGAIAFALHHHATLAVVWSGADALSIHQHKEMEEIVEIGSSADWDDIL